ncbi:hypothetical protein AB0I98_29210 [Streptomyces sp. NPDC050211]|uniref:hypothetical protein n=1 Tax=Streptomyces sp. NPDC050211 TaxID=3154932 RepID=UPI0034245CCF
MGRPRDATGVAVAGGAQPSARRLLRRLVGLVLRRRQPGARAGDPFRVYVDSTATRLWMAGDPHPRRVVSVPGGARPLGVAMSTADNRNP